MTDDELEQALLATIDGLNRVIDRLKWEYEYDDYPELLYMRKLSSGELVVAGPLTALANAQAALVTLRRNP